MATSVTDDPKYVVTGEVRLNFPNLFKPRSQKDDEGNDGKAKYSCLLLIPKTDTKTIEKIKKAQQAALVDLTARNNGKKPVGWKNTFRDGDEERDTEEYPEYAGHMFMNVSANEGYPPGVVDRNLDPIIDASEIYSGVYAHVAINAFAFVGDKSKGVSFGLRHVQKTRDGEPLSGGGEKAEDVFSALDPEDEGDAGLL